MFLRMLVGQDSYAQQSGGGYLNGGELDDIVIITPRDSHDPCDPFSSAYNLSQCIGDSGDPCDPFSSFYDPYLCGGDTGDPCDPFSYAYSQSICYGDNGGTTNPDPNQTPISDVSVQCVSDIKDKLRALTQSNFSNILDKFGPNSLYKVNISIGSLGGGSMDLARTMNGAAYRTYDIIFNQDYPKVTSLSIVTSLIHEYIHAYFKTLYDDFTNNNNIHAYDQFPILKQFYTDTTYVGSIQDAHHEQMATTYIDVIAATIQEFQTGNPVSVGNADQFYKDMAWSSFDGTPVFSNTLVQSDIDRIRSERAAETYNEIHGASTPQGTSCK